MPYLYNPKETEKFRKGLRNAMPHPEKVLWGVLRNQQLGIRFRRQYGAGKYLLDFYAPSVRLAIEADGDSHFQECAEEYDEERTRFLAGQHVTVLRFTNLEIVNALDSVVERVEKEIEALQDKN